MTSAADLRTKFGVELKDAFKPVDNWVGQGIKWLEDIQQFYKERSSIEKDYAKQLLALSKRYHDRKAKKSAALSVGDSPQVTPGSLEAASLVTWTGILNETENLARERDRLGADLDARVAGQCQAVSSVEEELRKRCSQQNDKLVEDRDRVYGDLKKTKKKYDDSCSTLESSRKRQASSHDSSKSEKHYRQHMLDMNNAKNTYLISINVANAHKQKYYHQDIPELLNSLQDLNESRVRKLNGLWALSADLETQTIDRCKNHLQQLTIAVSQNVPNLDSSMFVQHNASGWSEPTDFQFEASPIWHDDERLITDEAAKVFLRNKVSKSRRSLGELTATVDSKKKEVEGLKNMATAYGDDPSLGSQDEVLNNLINAISDAALCDNKKLALAIEVLTITKEVGDIDAGTQPHSFKSASFTIPTTCDFCQSTIWGLSKQGFSCRECGYNCHTKCEMKVPASCTGVMAKKSRRKNGDFDEADDTLTLSRSDTQASFNSGSSTTPYGLPKSPTVKTDKRKSFIGSFRRHHASKSPDRMATPSPPLVRKARALYDYQPVGDDELDVGEGDEIEVVEPDDGSGWMRASIYGRDGLIPASYVELIAAPPVARPASMTSSVASSKKKGPAVAPKRGAKKLKYVVALYDYAGRSELELTIHEGDRIIKTGDDTGDGWMEGELDGNSGSFPSNYVEAA